MQADPAIPGDIYDIDCCPSTTLILAIYDRLGVNADLDATPQAKAEGLMLRGEAMITYMLDQGLGQEYIQNLPAGIAMPIMEILRVCQASPRKDWTAKVYDFIGRADLAAQARGERLGSRDKNELVGEWGMIIADYSLTTRSLPLGTSCPRSRETSQSTLTCFLRCRMCDLARTRGWKRSSV